MAKFHCRKTCKSATYKAMPAGLSHKKILQVEDVTSLYMTLNGSHAFLTLFCSYSVKTFEGTQM